MNPIERALANADKITSANRALEAVSSGRPAPKEAGVYNQKPSYAEAQIDRTPFNHGGKIVAVKNGDTWHQLHGNGTTTARPNWTDEHAAGHAQEMQRIANIFSDRSTDKRAGVKSLPRPTGTVGKYSS